VTKNVKLQNQEDWDMTPAWAFDIIQKWRFLHKGWCTRYQKG